jgi:hypothetical protein
MDEKAIVWWVYWNGHRTAMGPFPSLKKAKSALADHMASAKLAKQPVYGSYAFWTNNPKGFWEDE